MNTVLFVTHKPKRCGVYDFGKNVFDCIKASGKFHFVKAECASLDELFSAIEKEKPGVIIYNYHPSVLPWITDKVFKGINRNNISHINAIQIGIIHEVTQELADNATAYRNKYIPGPFNRKLNSLFDFYIAADPTLLLKNPFVFKTGRLIPTFNEFVETPAIPTIGSFGFGTPNKGFEDLVQRVQEEFDEAIININIPTADFDDPQGINARKIAAECKSLIKKPGISLNINHDFLSQDALLKFLSANSMNCFFYKDKNGRGISSAIDYALAVKRPVAITDCPMFRHVLAYAPGVSIERNTLKNILASGIKPIEPCIEEWQPANLVWDYERIIQAAIDKTKFPHKAKMGIKRTIKAKIAKIATLPSPAFTWLRNTQQVTGDQLEVVPGFQYKSLPASSIKYNRILNDEAREQYKGAIETLHKLVPVTMAKKIARANVQQAFVFDTVYNFLQEKKDAKLLCVGSYEDTASWSLRKMGFPVEEIDPVINYYLQDFYTKPTVQKNSYDIVFSTSVIEHDPDDKSFIECIEGLLKPGGVAVITLDYKDGWKPGDLKPDVDERFYTKQDLQKRLVSYLKHSALIDEPDWEDNSNDFTMGIYQYSFASFVFRKKQ